MYIVEKSVAGCGMIGVKALFVIFTFTDDNRLSIAINEGAFISFVSVDVLWRANIQSLKSTVTESLTFSGTFIVPILKLSGIFNFEKVKLFGSPNQT